MKNCIYRVETANAGDGIVVDLAASVQMFEETVYLTTTRVRKIQNLMRDCNNSPMLALRITGLRF